MERFELQLEGNARRDLTSASERAPKPRGLLTTQVTTLSKYPGSVHWHFKKGKGRGTLEATYWPERHRAWLSYRSGREAEWIAPAIRAFMRVVRKSVRSPVRKRLYSVRRSPIPDRGAFA